ncbi:putative acyl-CoA dehydrogenase IBR3 [Smittium culicis]|uniref:Putative acyl-CoA dehydrogenase IBR3 n=1 Tax=Smittium culicis TaxID=133412 RepID=A0A1R1XA88_9FUNG|nr:putative acyl-CoA dehydrogenase IBR3 [Smittium culicis]
MSKTAHAVEREFRIIDALCRNTSVPVPKAYLLCTDTSVIGTPFYVMEFLDGRIFVDPAMAGVGASEKPLYLQEMVRVLAQLHAVDFKSVGLDGYGKEGGYYQRQCKSLVKVHDSQAEAVDTVTGTRVGPLPNFYKVTHYLQMNHCPDDISIIHGDYKVDNVVFHKSLPKIIGILDWELSTIGNPRTDLANMTQNIAFPSVSSGLSSIGDINAPFDINSGFNNSILKQYCSLTGFDFPLPGWKYANIFSFYRNSVIYHGIAARVARGQASSKRASTVAKYGPISILRSFKLINSSNL